MKSGFKIFFSHFPQVAVYKSHPNLAHSSAKYIRQLMKSLIDEDFLAVIEGTIEPGQTLIASESVDELLMTGGAATFDRIVWGDDPNAKQSGQPLVTKPFEAELGAVSPWVLVPGQWSDADLKHHAEYLVSCKMMNSGAICASPQVVVYDEQWPQIDKFQQLVEQALADFPELPVFYGGSCQRATSIASDTKGKVSWPKGKVNCDFFFYFVFFVKNTFFVFNDSLLVIEMKKENVQLYDLVLLKM